MPHCPIAGDATAERGGATSDEHQAMRPHLTSSVTFALVASEATGRLQTKVAARRNPFVPREWLRAHRWLWTPLSALGRRQRSHCSANLHSARRQELGGGTESMEQSSRHTAKTEHWICAVQTTFNGISVWRDCIALTTFCSPCIKSPTHSLTHSPVLQTTPPFLFWITPYRYGTANTAEKNLKSMSKNRFRPAFVRNSWQKGVFRGSARKICTVNVIHLTGKKVNRISENWTEEKVAKVHTGAVFQLPALVLLRNVVLFSQDCTHIDVVSCHSSAPCIRTYQTH